MDASTIINYQVCYENQTGYDLLYDGNRHGYTYPDGEWPTLNDFDPDFQTHSPEPLTDPAIHDFINLILPTYTGQIDNGEFRNMTQQSNYVAMDSESDTDSVMIPNEDLQDLPCGKHDDYLDTDSSIGSGHFDNYVPPHIPSPVYQSYNNQTLPSFDQLVQSTTKHFPSTTRQCVSDDDDDEESEAIVKKGKRGAKNILLWKFLLDELADAQQKHIRWISCKEGTFRFVDTAEISKMWGAKKRKNDMNFEKLSRGIRHYYKSGFMRREDGTRLVYKFNWKKVPKEYRRRFAL
ncbi:transcription factor ets-4-like [Pecten maximus]|uniref:transcription factor ets-4-like n=1 Tax=Pecten maximus TaxID=6579 RepID=UPI00145901E7|nr:transcription factor ets-4-like [Pecten maximus]XP_033752344.1 transcription factor ets-4-like [Pecten maximus]XP_033752345.1 transcription factor ets-4-like [Pecten maximus]XP_033752347.1 transcription factor ets-4-like [Pecten maximus]